MKLTSWTYKTYNNRYKFTKRYVVYSFTWHWEDERNANDYPVVTNDYAEFDDLVEVSEHLDLIEGIYKDVEKPILIKEHALNKHNGSIIYKGKHGYPYSVDQHYEDYKKIPAHYECENGKKHFWGYMVIDYHKEDFIKMGGDRHPEFYDYKRRLEIYDCIFRIGNTLRKTDPIPKDYEWDKGEYEGWLQYRWGNGLNAIDKEDEINRQKKIEADRKREEKQKQIEEFNKLYNDIA